MGLLGQYKCQTIYTTWGLSLYFPIFPNWLVGGILVALVFVGSFAVLGYAIEAKKAEIRSGIEQFQRQMENLGGSFGQQQSQDREKTEDWYDKGNSLVDQKKYNDAIIAFTKCVETEPSHAACYLGRAIAYEAISDYKEAILDYDRIIDLRPEDALIYFYRGEAYAQIGDTQQQIDNYKIAAQLGHEDAQELLKKADIAW